VTTGSVRLGVRANAGQFTLLLALNAVVGALVGLERSVLPLVGRQDFGVRSHAALLAFVVAFGATKALANLAAGGLADRLGRKNLLTLGWLLALPLAPLVAFAPGWWAIVVANLFLGASQGLAWSMTVVMKIDLAGPVRRGLAVGLNESVGYVGVAAAAFATGALAASYTPRTVVWAGALALAVAGLLGSAFVHDTSGHVAHEQLGHAGRGALPFRHAFAETTIRSPVLRACSQAGMVNNLNDALAWGLVPLYLSAHGASVSQIGTVAAVYPAVWGSLQLAVGWLSDHTGRKRPIVLGMLVQGAALALLVAGKAGFGTALAAAALLGLGTALVYPTLIAAVSDAVEPRGRAPVVGVYRFWRDAGLVAGALLAGFVSDGVGTGAAIVVVAALTTLSGALVATTDFASADKSYRQLPLGRWTEET
jgi:MFS family permease